jgi:hypothetical protein
MTKHKRRFIAMHETEAGFESVKAVQKHIAINHPDDCHRWRVVEIIVDHVTAKICSDELARAKEQGFLAGAASERRRMRQLLGIDVLGGSSG